MYLVISVLVLLVSFLLFNRYGASLNPLKLNLYSYVFWYHIILESFIAAVLVIHHVDYHYMIEKAGETAKYWGWLSVLWTMIALPLGMGTGGLLAGIKNPPQKFEHYCRKPLQTLFSKKDVLTKIVIHGFLFVSIFCTLYVYRIIGKVPVLEAIKSPGSAVLASMRIDVSRDFTGNQFIRNLGSLLLSQILPYICYGYYKLTKKLTDKVYFLLSLGNVILALTYNLAKSPIFVFFLGFLFIKVLIDGRIEKKIFVMAAIVVLLGIVGAYILTMGNVEIAKLLFSYNSGIVGRIILSQAAGTYLSFELFPRNFDFIGIRSLSQWLPQLFGMKYSERSARLLMEHINPQAVEAGTAGVINSLFIGEAWANFGIGGVIVSPLFIGIFIGFLFQLILKFPKSPVYIGLLTYLSLNIPVTGGFNDFIYPISIIIAIFLVIFIKHLIELFNFSVGKSYTRTVRDE